MTTTAGTPDGARTGALGIPGLVIWPPRRVLRAVLGRPLARDVLLLQASNFLQKGYGFVFSVAAVRLLGRAGYGDFLSVLSLYQTVNLVGSLGLGQFLVVPLAQAAAAGKREEVAQAAGYNLKLSALLAVIVLLLALTFGPWLGQTIILRQDLGDLMRIVALGGIPAVAYNISTTALQSVRRMRDLAMVENVDIILGRSLPLLAVVAGWGLPGLLWGTAIGASCSAAHAIYQYRRVAVRHHGFPDLGALAREAWRVPFGRYFRFSALAVVDKNVAQFFGQTPVLFLARWAGAEQVGLFGIAAKVFTLLHACHGAAAKAFSVRLSQELARRGAAATRRLFWRITLGWGALAAAGAAVLLLLLPVFRWIYGHENLPDWWLVFLFGLLAAKQGLTVSLGSIFLIMDRVAVNVLAKLPLLALSLPVGAILVQRWGATGAAVYQLGAFTAGDLMYFAILSTPWFWRSGRRGKG
jgi:O-antigen/teichoic acid export membrane protein